MRGTDFDLLKDPWIPVQTMDGRHEDVSLPGVFARAHELCSIADPSPLVTFGLLRFMVAVLLDVHPLEKNRDWAKLWTTGRFPEEIADTIRDRYTGRMRLFDVAHPFYQSADTTGKADKTIGYLAPEAATATNVVHFDHGGDRRHAYCPACCAKGLVALSAFATSGGAGIRPSLPGVPPQYVAPSGEALFQTLMLNAVLPRYQPAITEDIQSEPAWMGDGRVPRSDVVSSVGFLQGLTWQARRVRLEPGTGGSCSRCGIPSVVLVRSMVYEQGWQRPDKAALWEDPWAAYRKPKTGDKDLVSVKPRESGEAWRDFNGLFLAGEADNRAERRRPRVLDQIHDLAANNHLPSTAEVRYETFGLRTDGKAKRFEWSHDVFRFPLPLLDPGNRASVGTLREALEDVQKGSSILGFAVKLLHPICSRDKPDAEARRAAMKGLSLWAERQYRTTMEGAFRGAVADSRLLGDQATLAEWKAEWRLSATTAARTVFEPLADSFDATAEDLRRQQKARAYFFGQLKQWVGDQPAPERKEEVSI